MSQIIEYVSSERVSVGFVVGVWEADSHFDSWLVIKYGFAYHTP